MPTITYIATEHVGFFLLSILGSGDFGTVWDGVDAIGRPIAVKVVTGPDAPHAIVEAIVQSGAAKDDDRIVRPSDLLVLNGDVYIVMERCDGSLADLRKRATFQPRDWMMPVAAAVLGALDVVHERGNAHGDVSARNVLYIGPHEPATPDLHRLKLSDFGLARRWFSVEPDNEFPAAVMYDVVRAAELLDDLDPSPEARTVLNRAMNREFVGEMAALRLLLALGRVV
jgi:serine/threonine protein kinase